MERVIVKIPAAQFYSWSWWEERMEWFLKENNIPYTLDRMPVTDRSQDYHVGFWFDNKIDASQFAIVWVNYDWGLAHHPV